VVSENKSRCDDLIHGADHWENVEAFGMPCWAKNCIETFRHRDHVFFKMVKNRNKRATARKGGKNG
jgi:hypothetical protein